MSALSHFFAMGGYAGYVWPAYAVFFAVLIADSVAPRLRRRRILRDLRGRLARQTARERRSTSSTPAP
ncbi:heme exporter protein CcmD [Rhodanobacter sp. DHG33]|uniref:heme exporter protein CcmD n=1 Tax=Rhodanobacter sp. DHG33 TaxID=2775921 RepID=UPI001785E766|nr:heme exporter protein CcmD [Rhodanobacter sp. DHG33]MBD8897924.1 heme exporter protein CcmD [Rhodanobacter sp. DHG33]